MREYQYWDCAFPEEDDLGAEHYREEVRELLADSVRRRLVSDVPLGVLLSGGIDSRLVATFAGDAADHFTIGFGIGKLTSAMPLVGWLMPLAPAPRRRGAAAKRHGRCPISSSPTTSPESRWYRRTLSRNWRGPTSPSLCRVSAGTSCFPPTRRTASSTCSPASIVFRTHLSRRVADLSESSRGIARHYGFAGMASDDRASRRLLHQTNATLRGQLLSPDVRAAVDLDGPTRHLERHYERAAALHPLNRLLYVYLKTYLPDELLRASTP